MEHGKLTKRTIVLLTVLCFVALIATFYLGIISADDTGYKQSGIVADTGLTSFEEQKVRKENELKEILLDFDKENIVETWVSLDDSDSQITSATIIVVSHEEIIDQAEQDGLVSLASENLDLDAEDIHMTYLDVETFMSPEKLEERLRLLGDEEVDDQDYLVTS
ncbi:MAG: hypothetical protein LBV33_04325 [Lachnospiraceae bacterium]|jgi:G3E family GTPase|nr:hypothetical protein [Lachnospiraceae bacterium]